MSDTRPINTMDGLIMANDFAYTERLQRELAASKKRIKELAHARHDERRAKEAALREREEAIRVAQQLVEENKKLRGYVNTGEQTFAEVLKSKAEADLEMARRKYKEAAEAYDTDVGATAGPGDDVWGWVSPCLTH